MRERTAFKPASRITLESKSLQASFKQPSSQTSPPSHPYILKYIMCVCVCVCVRMFVMLYFWDLGGGVSDESSAEEPSPPRWCKYLIY
jgi:hypothetical protein